MGGLDKRVSGDGMREVSWQWSYIYKMKNSFCLLAVEEVSTNVRMFDNKAGLLLLVGL